MVAVLEPNHRHAQGVGGILVGVVCRLDINLRNARHVVCDVDGPAFEAGGSVVLALAVDLQRTEIDPLDAYRAGSHDHFAHASTSGPVHVVRGSAATEVDGLQL